MPAPTHSDKTFIEIWKRLGSPTEVAQEIGVTMRNVMARRQRIEKRYGISLATVPRNGIESPYSPRLHFERRRRFCIENGVVVVFSDPHWLPDHSTVAHDALETLIKRLKPVGVICGGDAVDGDTISRYDPTRGHHKRFTVREELDCAKEHFDSLDKVMDRYCRNAWRAWTLGNHDVRLSRFVAVRAPELMDLPFTRLEDWVPRWPLSWTVEINSGTPGMTVIRHRNQAKAGCHYVHGHLHRLGVHRQPTFAGPRYSVDAGSLADPESSGFDYTEGNVEHVQGFVVLTYHKGRLMPPELCEVVDGVAWFRGAPV